MNEIKDLEYLDLDLEVIYVGSSKTVNENTMNSK